MIWQVCLLYSILLYLCQVNNSVSTLHSRFMGDMEDHDLWSTRPLQDLKHPPFGHRPKHPTTKRRLTRATLAEPQDKLKARKTGWPDVFILQVQHANSGRRILNRALHCLYPLLVYKKLTLPKKVSPRPARTIRSKNIQKFMVLNWQRRVTQEMKMQMSNIYHFHMISLSLQGCLNHRWMWLAPLGSRTGNEWKWGMVNIC